MRVLVDTCVWSQVLRHKNPNLGLTKKMKDLINDGRVSIIGPIRQELLSGIPDIKQFNHLKNHFPLSKTFLLKQNISKKQPNS